MKNHDLLKIVSLLAGTAGLLAIAQIVTGALLGYSGFKDINAKAVLTLGECQQEYTNQRFGVGLKANMQVVFICGLACVVCSMAVVLLSVCLLGIVYCRRSSSEQREDTRIEELQQNQQEIERYHANLSEIVFLYVVLTLSILSSYVTFNFYTQIPIFANSSTCQINYQSQEVIPLAALALAMMLCSLGALIVVIVIGCRFNQRMKMMEGENGSESYRQQIDRIIREIPDSERRIYEMQGRPSQIEIQQLPQERMEREHSASLRSAIRIEEVPRVQSIIYKADPQLMLQSVNANRPMPSDVQL